MADKSLDIQNTFYREDISTLAAGTALITCPATLWTIVFSVEASGTYVINFSDDANGYTAAHRIGKIVLNGPTTNWEGFGKSMPLKRGLSATCNAVGVDVFGVYD